MLQECAGLEASSNVQQLENLAVACVQHISNLSLGKDSPASAPLQQCLNTLLQIQQDIQQARLAAQAHSAALASANTADASACIANLEDLLRLQAYGDLTRGQKQALRECQQHLADVLGRDTATAVGATFETLYATWVQKLKEPVQVIPNKQWPVIAIDTPPQDLLQSMHALRRVLIPIVMLIDCNEGQTVQAHLPGAVQTRSLQL